MSVRKAGVLLVSHNYMVHQVYYYQLAYLLEVLHHCPAFC